MVELLTSFPLPKKENAMRFRESVQAVKELPSQVKLTANLAISALIVALIALTMAIVGVSRAH